jgi:UDP-N-acetylglucosamine--N-acetylmuramyl-(pentapeptide) pyrophosphoryl-undecaprenol N-acetylglucosamine transferase
MNIFFAGGGTGGHLYPGLAIARALVRADARIRPFFIGARRGIERDILPTTEFPFELLDLHPLYRSQPWHNWKTLIGGVSAWRRVAQIAQERRPVALVATGGYAAGVALGYASAARLPIIIQEQNSFPGATVRLFAPRARQIHLGFPEAERLLRRGGETEIFDTGNPIEPPADPRPQRAQLQQMWSFASSPDANPKTVLIFGGSQGAQAINKVVAQWISSGCTTELGVQVIWSTGKASYDQYKHLESGTVKVRPYISPMADAYALADLAISRAGAMATAELAAWGIPMLLIPLPTAAADHQTANARAIAEAGAATLIPQQAFTAEALDAAVRRVVQDETILQTMREAALQRARPYAAQDIANKILSIIT